MCVCVCVCVCVWLGGWVSATLLQLINMCLWKVFYGFVYFCFALLCIFCVHCKCSCCMVINDGCRVVVASFPGLPCCIQYNHGSGRHSEKRGRPGLIHHVNDVRWTRGGRFEYWPLPPMSTSCPLMWWMRVSLSHFWPFFHFRVLYWTQNKKEETRETLEWGGCSQ